MSYQIYIDTVTATLGNLSEIVTLNVDLETLESLESDSEIIQYGKEHGKPVAPAVKSQYFHTDSPKMISWLADVLATARDTETRIRIDVDSEGRLKVKRGEGMWSPPFESTEDPWRDR